MDGRVRGTAQQNHGREYGAKGDREHNARAGLRFQELDGNSDQLDERLRDKRDMHADGGHGCGRDTGVHAQGQLCATVHAPSDRESVRGLHGQGVQDGGLRLVPDGERASGRDGLRVHGLEFAL